MLEGKKAVVTGAAQGIGQAIAEILAQGGADVVVADLDAGRCQETADRVKKRNRQVLPLSVNVGNWEDVKALVDKVVKDWGRIDIFVNNAGITRDGLVVRMKGMLQMVLEQSYPLPMMSLNWKLNPMNPRYP